MKRVNLIVLVLLACCCLAIPPASGKGGNVEQQISALSDQEIQAQLKGDTGFYEKYYADDATIVHGNGKVYTKDQDIADLKSGSLKYEALEVRERKIHVYGDTAVVNFWIFFKGVLAGQPFSSADLRRTVVWVKQKEGWKIVLYQVTRIPAAK